MKVRRLRLYLNFTAAPVLTRGGGFIFGRHAMVGHFRVKRFNFKWRYFAGGPPITI
jgi:hypothetical protein